MDSIQKIKTIHITKVKCLKVIIAQKTLKRFEYFTILTRKNTNNKVLSENVSYDNEFCCRFWSGISSKTNHCSLRQKNKYTAINRIRSDFQFQLPTYYCY